jgi:hypothetical protein
MERREKVYRATHCAHTSPLPLLPSGPGGVGGITSRRTRHNTILTSPGLTPKSTAATNFARKQTTFYAEFNSTGPGANPAARVPWSHQLTSAQVKQFLPARFLSRKDHWNLEAEAKKLP